eukprot:4422456-Lingulodinium_polyedra.AAC.1
MPQDAWPQYEASDEIFLNQVRHCFQFIGFPVLSQSGLPQAPVDSVSVIKGLRSRAPSRAVSDNDLVSLRGDCWAGLLKGTGETAVLQRPSKQEEEKTPGSLLDQFPGMVASLGPSAGSSRGSGSGDVGQQEDEGNDAGPPEEADEDQMIQDFFDAMERERPDVQGVAPVPRDQDQFRSRPRADGDCIQGQVLRHGAAAAWCKRTGLQQTVKFKIAALGVGQASVLGNAWAARVQFLYDADKEGLLHPADRRARALATMVWPPVFVELQAQST